MNKGKKRITTIFAILCLYLLSAITVLAAEGSVTYGSSSYSATQGENFDVGVYVKGSEAIGSYEFYLDYNTDMLEYVSGADSGGSGRLKFVGNGNSDSYKYMLTFKAKTAGTSNISISNVYLGPLNLDSGDSMNITTAASAPITIQGPSTASSECRLKSINISPTGFWQDFSPDKTEYDITVESDVEHLTISAEPISSTATVQVSNTDLKEGINNITITVTAENGDTKDYTIIVRKDKKSEQSTDAAQPTQSTESTQTTQSTTQPPTETTEAQQPATVPEIEGLDVTKTVSVNGKEMYFKEDISGIQIPAGFEVTTITYKEQEVPAFKSTDNIVLFYLADGIGENAAFYVYEEEQGSAYPYIRITNKSGSYLVLSADNTIKAPAGYTETTLSLASGEENIPTNVTAWVSGEDTEFYLVYARNENGEKNFYQYDSKEKTLQRYHGVLTENGETIAGSDSLQQQLNQLKSEKQKDTKNKLMIIIILAFLCVILIILVITLIFRLKGQMENEDGDLDRYLQEEEMAMTKEIPIVKAKKKKKEPIEEAEEELEENTEELNVGSTENDIDYNVDVDTVLNSNQTKEKTETAKETKRKNAPTDPYALSAKAEKKLEEQMEKESRKQKEEDFLVDLDDDDDFTFFDYDEEEEEEEDF